MKVIEQLCIKGFEITAENGDYWGVIQGRTYLTTEPEPDEEMVTVFSRCWVSVPKKYFVIKETAYLTTAKRELTMHVDLRTFSAYDNEQNKMAKCVLRAVAYCAQQKFRFEVIVDDRLVCDAEDFQIADLEYQIQTGKLTHP